MTALGNQAHMFARPYRRDELIRCFENVLPCAPVASITHPAIPQPMLLVSFPGGGHLSIEFTEDAPDSDAPRLGAWLELRTADPAALMRAALDAGLAGQGTPVTSTTWSHPAARYSPSWQATRGLLTPAADVLASYRPALTRAWWRWCATPEVWPDECRNSVTGFPAPLRPGGGHDLVTRFQRRDHLDVRLQPQQRCQRLPDHRGILRQQHPDHPALAGAPRCRRGASPPRPEPVCPSSHLVSPPVNRRVPRHPPVG